MAKITLTGSMVALLTPMRTDGSIDYTALRRLVDWHVAEGTDAIVAAGTSGESATVNVQEHMQIIRTCIEQAAGRVPVVAGCGANSTSEAIALAKMAQDAGADYQLQVVPYYNKPMQEGLFQHFHSIAQASPKLPMIVYNVPGRTVADMLPQTTLRLAQVPGIVGIKDATGNIDRAQYLIAHAPEHFAVYSGDDSTANALMLCGGHGNISVTANVAPRLMHELCASALRGDALETRRIHQLLMPLNTALFIESNPIPVKWALARMGFCSDTLRLPLTSLAPTHHAAVEHALRAANVAL